jgi:fatty-acyl-CoA synthase
MIQPHVLERFAETFGPHGFRRDAFVPSYGMAEATLAVSVAPLERGVEVDHIDRDRLAAEQRAVPVAEGETTRGFALCGSALPGHEIEIRSETGETLAERQVGRVFVRGPSIAPCYVGEPEASAAVFVDGWLDTGDLGYLIDGAVVITGRSKDLILINGRNVWPQDIDWAIETRPGLRRGDVAAFAVEEALAPPRVVVLIQCRRTDPEEREALVRDARAMASTAASVEAEIVLVRPHGLPVTSSGKLSRARARKDNQAGAFTDPTDEAGPSKAAAVGA